MTYWGSEPVNGRNLPLREHAAAVARDAMGIGYTHARCDTVADELRNAISAAWLAVDRLPHGRERDAIGRGLERVKAFADALVKP